MRRHFSVLARDGLVQVQARVLPSAGAAKVAGKSVDATEKIRRAVLYLELNATKRRLIFRPTKAHLLNQYDPPAHNGELLSPTEYLGVPSKADYDAVLSKVSSGHEAEAVAEMFEKCVLHKTTARNLKPDHLSYLLRKAAEFGSYEKVYHYLTCRQLFEPLMTPEVYLEALRIVALRVPDKGSTIKSLLFSLYKRAPEDARREAALLYGLSQCTHAARQAEECIARIMGAELTLLEPVDGALLMQAGHTLGKQFDLERGEGEDAIVYKVAVGAAGAAEAEAE